MEKVEEYYKVPLAQLQEATLLSEEILRNIEMSELPLSSIALRVARLCRLLGLDVIRKIFEYEAGGYPITPEGVTSEVWKLAVVAGRTYKEKNASGEIKEYAYVESIDALEEQIRSARAGLGVSADPNVNISSANPHQRIGVPLNNKLERQNLINTINKSQTRLAQRKAHLYKFVLARYLQLKFSNLVSDFFSNVRRIVDENLVRQMPEATEKLSSILVNLQSDKAEDWSNAVHSCRRLLESLADSLFPPQEEPRQKGKASIKLGKENYINRLICYVEDQSGSHVYASVVGSTLDFLGNRLDAVFDAAQKGSHSVITERYEAERYVVYTYMAIGDILRLASLDKTGIESTANTETSLPGVDPEKPV